MIENTCDNCKLKPACKHRGRYEIDRKHLLAMPASLPPLRGETTAIIVQCKLFTPTQAAQMAEAAVVMQKLQQALAPLAELGKTAGGGKTDTDGGGN